MENKKLNLGCGNKIRKGYVNVDIAKLPGVDKVVDLNKFPYPFKDNTFSEVFCDNVLEHLDDLNKVMEELHRILQKDGKLVVKVPYYAQVGAYSDPTHKHLFTLYTMDYYCKRKKTNYYFNFSFKMKKKKLTFLYEYHRGLKQAILFLIYLLPKIVYEISPWFYSWFWSFVFPASEVIYVLEK